MSSDIHTELVDYHKPEHAEALVRLMKEYAAHPMGGGQALSAEVQHALPSALATQPGAFSILAFRHKQAIGLVNCFMGFSTFKCRPLVNIHDVIVSAEARGLGISHMLLKHVETHARGLQCCKLTLEVLEGNAPAQKAYQKFGFRGYELKSEHGKALFWEKPLLEIQ